VDARVSEPDWHVLTIRGDPALVEAITKTCGITKQAIWQWTKVPRDRVLVVARIMGLEPWMLRPDFYPPPPGVKPWMLKRRRHKKP
jgi:hypothetical protein